MFENILDIIGTIWIILIVGAMLFLVGGYAYISFIVNYSGFFKSAKVRKRFFNDVKKYIEYRFSKEKQQETRTIILITIMAIVVAIVTFLFD